MVMNVTAAGSLPNSGNVSTTFQHSNFFHLSPLSSAPLVDPGLELSYSNTTKNFTVTAASGVSVWTWLDYSAGAVVTFDDNAFLLRKGESRQIGYTVKSDTTGGSWVGGVTVASLWNNTLDY